MDKWFQHDIAESGKAHTFAHKSRGAQYEEFHKASRKRARQQAGMDIYAEDPIMRLYCGLSYDQKRQFDRNNNCYAWASGSMVVGAGRLALPMGGTLCPQPGDSLQVPFLYLTGHPHSVFGHLSALHRLCRLDGLTPVRVRRSEPLPETSAQERLIGIALYRDEQGASTDYHCVVRAPGSVYFSNKPDNKRPPSMLDLSGRLITDPRQADFESPASRWMFFRAPAAGLSFPVAPEARAAAQHLVGNLAHLAETIPPAVETLVQVAQRRSPRFAAQLASFR
jgi:hypothetical protein